MKWHKKRQSGLTLVELLITMGMMSIFMVTLTDIFVALMSAKLESDATSTVSQEGRAIVARLEYDIGRATSLTTPENLSVSTSVVTGTTATVGWTTATATNGRVEYGLTSSYGSSSALSPSFVFVHSIGLSGLTAGTTYHFRVISQDSGGNTTTSADYVFTTTGGAVTHVQTNGVTNNTSSTSVAQSFSSNVGAGNLIVASLSFSTSTGATLSQCSDNRGNVYYVATYTVDSTTNRALAICYAPNAAAGATTVTATFSAAATTRRLILNEYRGLQGDNVLDIISTNMATGTTAADNVTSSAATTGNAGELIFGAVLNTGADTTITAGTSFTQRAFLNNKDMAVQDRIQAAAGSVASTQTFGAARQYLAHMVTFKPSTATQPGKFGTTGQQLRIIIGGVTNTYQVVNGDLQLINGSGTNNLNGSEVTVSGLTFQRVGNPGYQESIQAVFTVTAKTTPRQGPESQVFTVTVGRR